MEKAFMKEVKKTSAKKISTHFLHYLYPGLLAHIVANKK